MVDNIGFDVLNKITLDAYKELCKKKDGCMYISLIDVRNKIIYNIDAKAYDIIYNFTVNNIEDHEVVKILDFNSLTYLEGRVVKNPAQIELRMF